MSLNGSSLYCVSDDELLNSLFLEYVLDTVPAANRLPTTAALFSATTVPSVFHNLGKEDPKEGQLIFKTLFSYMIYIIIYFGIRICFI